MGLTRRLVLISIDSLRADRLGVNGHPGSLTPHLDAFARGGVNFRQAVTTATTTGPSHATMLTGVFPPFHGVLENGWKVPPSCPPLLAEILGPRGVHAGGIVSVIHLNRFFGFDRGSHDWSDHSEWDRWVHRPVPNRILRTKIGGVRLRRILRRFGIVTHWSRDGRRTNAAAARWLRRRGGDPFFLFLHYFDVHRRHDRCIKADPSRVDLEGNYNRGATHQDAVLGELFEFMDRQGILKDTVILVTADHGDNLYEHGHPGHGLTLYEEDIRVPLIAHGPGLPAGGVVDAPVRTVDLAPTVLDLVGEPPNPVHQGRSLRPLWEGKSPPDAPAYLEGYLGGARGIRHGGWKLIRMDGKTKFEIPPVARGDQLYDLGADPRERRNVLAENPGKAAELQAMLDSIGASRARGPEEQDMDEQVQEALKGLGYL